MKKILSAAALLFLLFTGQAQTNVRHVILITIDGFRPEFYQDPSWPAPNLQHLMQEGAYARHVRSVFPTVTLPNHTAMTTGALPARSGVYANSPFTPLSNAPSWNFYAKIIKLPTLFDAVHESGRTTAAVDWPVTVGAKNIDYNMPDYWGFDAKSDNIAITKSGENPKGLWDELEANVLGKVPSEEVNSDNFLRTDENNARIAAYLIMKYKPTFMAFHITETDHAQHDHGREGYAVRAAVGAADRAVGSVLEAVERAGLKDSTAFLICGDHGFTDIHSALAPNVWLAQAGLFQKGDHWRVKFQSASGSGFLHVEDPKDTKVVAEALRALRNVPEKYRHLFRILERPELDRLGVDSSVALAFAPIPGIAVSGATEGDVLRPAHGGTHGFMNDEPLMFTGFIAYGAGINKGTVIPEMGTQDVAPIVAKLLGLDFPCPDGILFPALIKK